MPVDFALARLDVAAGSAAGSAESAPYPSVALATPAALELAIDSAGGTFGKVAVVRASVDSCLAHEIGLDVVAFAAAAVVLGSCFDVLEQVSMALAWDSASIAAPESDYCDYCVLDMTFVDDVPGAD